MQQHNHNRRVRPALVRRAMLGTMIASALAAPAAMAAEGPDGVRAGKNITVFHNIDMIATFGHPAGMQTRIDVFRGTSRIASTQGPAVDAGEGGENEANHGVEGAAAPGDCWVGATPDIRPGDRIQVSNPGGLPGVDDAIVDNIAITSQRALAVNPATGNPVIDGTVDLPHTDDDSNPLTPAEDDDLDTANPDPQPTRPARLDQNTGDEVLDERQEVWVEGVAEYVDENGDVTPIPLGDLDSFEFLAADDNQLRMAPTLVDQPAGEGTFRGRFWDGNGPAANNGFANVDRNRNNRSDAFIFNALANDDGHATGYGHVEVLPPVSMLVEGTAEATAPAVGCEAAPKLASSIGAQSTEIVNIESLSPTGTDPALQVGGWVADAVTSAEVVLTDGAGGEVVKSAAIEETGLGAKGFTADFTKADVTNLGQGALTAQLRVGGTLTGATRTVDHDTVAPAFTAGLPSGTYTGTQQLTISGATDPVTVSIDGAPAQGYNNLAIPLPVGTQEVVLRSVDPAGNVTTQTLNYTINAAPDPEPEPQPQNQQQAPSQPQTQSVAPPAVVLPAPAPLSGASRNAPRPVATILTTQKRIGKRKARRRGLRSRFSAPAGTRSAVIRVYRSKSGRLTLVAKRTVKAKRGTNRVALKSRKLRRKFVPGLYMIEVTLRGADRKGGEPATTFVRILR